MGNKLNKVIDLMKRHKIYKNLVLAIIFLGLYLPMNFFVNKYTTLSYVNMNSWSLELFIYSNLIFFVIFLWIFIFILFLELNISVIIKSKKIDKFIKIAKNLNIIVLVIAMIIKLILLYFTYELQKCNFENILKTIMVIEILFYIIIGAIIGVFNIVYLLVELVKSIKARKYGI